MSGLRDSAFENAAFFLPIDSLFQLSVVNKQLNHAFEELNIWAEGIQQALPGFRLNPSLLTKESRSAFLALVPTLIATSISGEVTLQSMDIACRIKKAVADQQRSNGSSARVNLVTAGFQPAGLRNAFKNNAVKHPVVVAASFNVKGPTRGPKASTFQMHIAWQCGRPIVYLRDDEVAPDDSADVSQDMSAVLERCEEDRPSVVNIDIKCLHPAVTMGYREAPLIVNAPTWQPLTSGMFYCSPSNQAKVSQILADGALFAISIRDGYQRNDANISRMLNLDKPLQH